MTREWLDLSYLDILGIRGIISFRNMGLTSCAVSRENSAMVQFTVQPGAVVFVKNETAELPFFRNKLNCLDSIWASNKPNSDELEKVGPYCKIPFATFVKAFGGPGEDVQAFLLRYFPDGFFIENP